MTVVIRNVLNLKIIILQVNNWEHLHEAKFFRCFTSVNILFPWAHSWLVGRLVSRLLCFWVRSLFGGALPAVEVFLDLKMIDS